MQVAIIVISVIAISTFVAGAALFFYFSIFKRNVKSRSADKSTVLFTLDLKERRMKSLQTKFHERTGMFDAEFSDWIPTSKLLSFFQDEEINRLFRETMHKLDGGEESNSFMYISKPHTVFRKSSLITFNFIKMKDNEFTVSIRWEPISTTIDDGMNNPDPITLDALVNNNAQWKGFISFNISSDVKNASAKFINLVYRLNKKESLNYLIVSGYVNFVVFGPTEQAVKKKINKFKHIMETQGFKRGANHLFNGSAYLVTDKANTAKIVRLIFRTLDFFVNKSIKDKVNFVTYDEKFDKDELSSFIEASKSFREATKINDIVSNKIPVRNWKSNRKTVEYVFPSVEGINLTLLNTILRNQNNKDLLMDSNATNIAINQVLDTPVLVDVNATWLLENKVKIVYQKAVYVVNLNLAENTDRLREAMVEMKQNGFVFGLRLTNFNEDVASLIQNTKPNFIVIDHKFWGERELFNTSLLIQLMTIKKLASSANIKMIYEDPSEFVDEETAIKIGLDFYYTLKAK